MCVGAMPRVRPKIQEVSGKTGEDLHSLLAFERATASCTPLVANFRSRLAEEKNKKSTPS